MLVITKDLRADGIFAGSLDALTSVTDVFYEGSWSSFQRYSDVSFLKNMDDADKVYYYCELKPGPEDIPNDLPAGKVLTFWKWNGAEMYIWPDESGEPME